jgi:glycosyltransferase involved in cell wall biosynthesis
MSNSWSTNERKGFDLLVEFSRLPGVEVRHIGRWPENLNPENVILLGPRRQPEVAELLRDGDYFVFPSQFDACSNVVVEALASGLPVIYHNSGGTPELCQEGRFGIPLPDNWSGSSQVVLESLIERGEDMKRDLRDNNNIFSFENCYQSYLIFFEALLADRLER